MLPSCAIPGHITAIYIFAVINLMALFHVTLVNADVYVINPQNETLEYFLDLPAQFGPQLPSEGLRGYVVVAKPHNACIPIQPPPNNDTNKKWIVLIRRLGCDFDIKVHYAQIAGYDAAIVHNVGSDDLIPMGAGKRAGPITIPSAFMGESNALNIEANFLWRTQYTLLMDDKVPFNPNFYLLPFAIVVGICFLLMLIFMIAKWVRDLRKRRRSRLSQQHLKKLPTKKFKKGETTEYETCAICLDDYEDGDKLRVLPCSHAYHLKCVDPWLTNSKRTCPVCKRKVIPGDEDDDSDSDSEDEHSTASPSETTPLLTATAGNSAPGRTSTFDSSGLPAAMRNEVTHVPLQSSTSPSSSSDDDTRGGATGAAGQDNAQGRRKRRWRWRFRRKRPTTQPVDAMEAASSSTGYHSDDGGNNQADYQTGNRIGAQGNWSGVDELSAGNVNQHPKDRKVQKQGSHDNGVAKQQSQKSDDNEAPEGAVGGLIDCDEDDREKNSQKEDNENTISIEADVEVIQPSREEEKTKGGGNGPV